MPRGNQAGVRKQVGEWEWNSTILWSKIEQGAADSCWQWQGSSGPNTNLFGGRKAGKPQMSQARRFLYMDVRGESCADLQITHSCGNAYCMNWQHFITKPNQHRFYQDGAVRGTRQPVDRTENLQRRQLKPASRQRWWQI